MEMNKKLMNMSGLGLGFRGEKKVRWALQNDGEYQLGAHINGKSKSTLHPAAVGNVMVLGPFASGNVSTRRNLLKGLSAFLHIFTE